MRARIVAPVVAALLGITGGAVAAIVTTDANRPDTPTTIEDPLGLGIPLVRLECNPAQGVLVLGFGDSGPALRTAIKANPDGEPSYVATDDSCDTIYGPERRPDPPDYAVILGPYDDLAEPCLLRMDPARRGDFVTALKSGNAMTVKCVCVLPDTAGPTLSVGMVPTDANRVWVRSLQGMFNDVLDDDFPQTWVTGEYDERTAAVVRDYQESSFVPSPSGVVDEDTWELLADRICDNYDF